ncbi:hypothetical protein [Zobellia galactanivorans]|uniref:Uncharacterized protein n=1 Tax=Zobellia galactanivorans (strain DSM 12802 / CCUG 47099 / CIP 106680 / NCIMB 13871 / Dsij) TaxID=63186 RepID=G0L4J6_ZOBGA|nr:hypothetical protein [Zobellia galactanivorans]MBU3026728.1 hypothetical protein [Zobellia galactanivorans]CAZ95748.1 Conserved hypothetical protein [Zobellia galactanivorans]
MSTQSNFKSDLEREQRLYILLDRYYKHYLKHYTFERVSDLRRQLKGIDLIFTHKTNGKQFFIDEKAQLDYVNENLPTFAFELSYEKKGSLKKGWLFDASKKTDFYALITSIYADAPNTFTSCKITLVNRQKLIALLKRRSITAASIKKYALLRQKLHGKIKLDMLHHRSEGYLFSSTKNKAERPLNLILKLDFLEESGVAKRLA